MTSIVKRVKDAIADNLRAQHHDEHPYISPREHNDGDLYVLSGCFSLTEVAQTAISASHLRIETGAELGELSVRTVIKEEFQSGNGAIWERWHCDTWVRLDSGPHVPGAQPFLPAIVLWSPEASR